MASEQEPSLNILQSQTCRVFGSSDFQGNPVGLHHLEEACPPALLLQHARSCPTMDNVFYWRTAESQDYYLRFFSHHDEIRMCGHGLLAAAYNLLSAQQAQRLVLETPVHRHQCLLNGKVKVELPLHSYSENFDSRLEMLCTMAGLQVKNILLFTDKVWLVITQSLSELERFSVESFKWHSMEPLSPAALIISCSLANGNYAFRYFAPWYGKQEDTGTGSAHCYLAAYWLAPGQEAVAEQHSGNGVAVMNITREQDCFWLSGKVVQKAPNLRKHYSDV